MSKYLIVDGNSILNRAYYGIRPLSNKEGFPTNAIYGMINILTKHIAYVEPDFCAVAFDLKAPTFRHKMYADYKAGRKPMPPELAAQFPVAKECIKALGMSVLELEGYEADDILGTFARVASEKGDVAYLLTGDRDSLQLIGENAHVLLATNKETIDYDTARFFEEYGVNPTQFVDVKALMGDSSDNIPGVAGIGQKTALKLIADNGSLDSLYENIDTAEISKGVREKLSSGKESAFMSRTLATICSEVPFDVALPESVAYRGIDKKSALELFERLELYTFIKKFELENVNSDQEKEEIKKSDLCISNAELESANIDKLCECVLSFTINEDNSKAYICDGEVLYSTTLNSEALVRLLEKASRLVCYDAKTIYKMLESVDVHYRGFYFDCMLAAYVLDSSLSSFELSKLKERYIGFDVQMNDALALLTLYRELSSLIERDKQSDVLFGIEMPLCSVLTDMELEGFKIDCKGIESYGEQLAALEGELESRIYFYAGQEFNIKSTKQLGNVLFEVLGLPPSKKTKTGYSTDVEVLEKLRAHHPIVEDILDYRQISKLRSTYVDGLLKVADENGVVHTTFKQTGTATGRLSSIDPNLQNIPVRTELGRELRKFFVPKSDRRVLVDADYSQIELRLLAHISDDENMIEAFKSGLDIHTSTASKVFGVAPDEVNIELRKRAKAVNFGILYGMGEFSLAEDLKISRLQAKQYIADYLASYPKIDAYLQSVKSTAKEQGYVTTLLGRRRYIPELASSNKNLNHFGERVAMNSPIQGSAADIIKIAMINVDKRLKMSGIDAKLILQVHDELLIDCASECADEAALILREEMENAIEASVPLSVGMSMGKNWYESK